MTKKKVKEVIDEAVGEAIEEAPKIDKDLSDIVKAYADEQPQRLMDLTKESIDIFIDPATTMKVILDTLERLEEKFDKTFNNHVLIHGRFRRGRRTLNR